MNKKGKTIALASLAIVIVIAVFGVISADDLTGKFRSRKNRMTPSAPLAAVCGNGIMESGEACDDGNTANWDTCSPTCTIPPTGNAFVNITTPGGSSGFSHNDWVSPAVIETCSENLNDWVPILQTYLIVDDWNFRLDRLPFMVKKAGNNPQDPAALKMTVSTNYQNWQGTAIAEYVVNNPSSVAQNPGGYFFIETGGLNLLANITYYLTFSIQRNPVILNSGENYDINFKIQTMLNQLAGATYGEFIPGGPVVGGQIGPVNPNANMNVYQFSTYMLYTMTACSH